MAPSSMHLSRLRKWVLDSPPIEWGLSRIRELLIGALAQGPVPQHVAFVMDGNRRFARSHGIERIEGHHLGFEALARVGFVFPFYLVCHFLVPPSPLGRGMREPVKGENQGNKTLLLLRKVRAFSG